MHLKGMPLLTTITKSTEEAQEYKQKPLRGTQLQGPVGTET